MSLGGQGHIPNSQEHTLGDPLPVDERAWVGYNRHIIGEANRVQDQEQLAGYDMKWAYTPVQEHASPFQRLCQASLAMGKVLSHNYWDTSLAEPLRIEAASKLYAEVSLLAKAIDQESSKIGNVVPLSAAQALTYSALACLCKFHASPSTHRPIENKDATTEAIAMQAQAVDGLKSVAESIVEFATKITATTIDPRELDAVSPVIMHALYSAALIIRESGGESHMALDTLRHCLKRLRTRWRNAAEYLMILEATELTDFPYAIGKV